VRNGEKETMLSAQVADDKKKGKMPLRRNRKKKRKEANRTEKKGFVKSERKKKGREKGGHSGRLASREKMGKRKKER